MRVPTTIITKDMMLRLVLEQYAQAINGGISLGDGTETDNISGVWASVTNGATPDVNITVTHGLGRIPVGYLVVSKDRACDVYLGSVAATESQITIKVNVANAVVRLFIL